MNDKLLGMVGLAVRARKAACGVFLTEKGLDDGSVKLVVAANDIGESNKRKIEYKCGSQNVRLIYYSTREQLSHSMGKKDAPVIGICDDNMAEAVVKIYGGVEQ